MKKLTNLIPPQVRRQISQSRRIEAVIAGLLPRHMADGLHLGSIEDDCCHLSSNNPGFAANLRFYEREICDTVSRELGRPICRVKLVIRHDHSNTISAKPEADHSQKPQSEVPAGRLRLREALKKL